MLHDVMCTYPAKVVVGGEVMTIFFALATTDNIVVVTLASCITIDERPNFTHKLS